jgi:ribonuclease-3
MKSIPTFQNNALFEQAFIHRSYLNETREKRESNERLEFLGDSILSFIISQHLYLTFPDFDEGILTNLRSLIVNTKSLAIVSKEYEFGNLLKLSRGEEDSKGRENESLLANCYESFLGALFIDQGIEAATAFVADSLFPKIDELMKQKTFKDPKSLLQEKVQAQKFPSPMYKVIGEDGPPHAKHFTIGVFVNDEQIGVGEGKSKQEGEEMAAKVALEKMGA